MAPENKGFLIKVICDPVDSAFGKIGSQVVFQVSDHIHRSRSPVRIRTIVGSIPVEQLDGFFTLKGFPVVTVHG